MHLKNTLLAANPQEMNPLETPLVAGNDSRRSCEGGGIQVAPSWMDIGPTVLKSLKGADETECKCCGQKRKRRLVAVPTFTDVEGEAKTSRCGKKVCV